jgi:hypothetical protein
MKRIAIDQGYERPAAEIATTQPTASGKSAPKASDCIPPIDEPIAAWRRSTPMCWRRRRCVAAMSSTVSEGKLRAKGRPVRGSTDDGPVDP